MTTQQTRTGTAGTGQPAAEKTLTITITMKARQGQNVYETFADKIAAQARELTKLWEFSDPGRATVEIDFSYPQWKRVYHPQEATPVAGQDHDQEEDHK